MKQPKELLAWDFGDTIQVPDGYDMTDIPDITRDNFNKLIDEHNNLVEVVNMLCDKRGIVFND
jgi:hypothetical protein